MEVGTIEDIYRCPHCKSIAARGDVFCRGCGIQFTRQDLKTMHSNIRSPIGSLPWNTRDRYSCVHCGKHIAITDKYCRGCGDKIDDHERQLMRLKLSELARKNSSSLIGLGLFVILVLLVSIAMVR